MGWEYYYSYCDRSHARAHQVACGPCPRVRTSLQSACRRATRSHAARGACGGLRVGEGREVAPAGDSQACRQLCLHHRVVLPPCLLGTPT
eukprot:2859566-Rhodomonas_salina.1